MEKYYSILLLLFIFITSNSAEAQPKMIRIQGVVSGNVACEIQDKEGNIWFSTGGEGAYRFDGKSFKNFTTKDGLCDNNVSAIIQDKSGNIVFGTRSGICTYDGKSFKKYTESDTLSTLRITSLLEDKDGNLWFGAMGNGLYRYDGKTLTNFLNNNDHRFNLGNTYQLIQDILQDKNGNLWFSTWNGGGVWRYDGKSFKNFLPPAEYYSSNEDGRDIANPTPKLTYTQVTDNITDDMINSLAEDKAGNIWFATRRHGACRYDGETFTSYRESEGFVSYGITSVIEDKHGKMWFGTDKNGVFSYDGKVFKNFTTEDGLVYDSVRSILEDKDGNLWFGTRGFGLSRFDGKTFTTFSE
ncbi:MAG TPA: two-component regulator propeller domain-containing protein [Patescibacteria group bacterium]|nr:two-component regulator propeller domain-containing protein [Patescibacteria group bacterium]